MKLRQAKKIFRREFLSIPYHKEDKASNRLIKALNILHHFRDREYWCFNVDKDRRIRRNLGGVRFIKYYGGILEG